MQKEIISKVYQKPLNEETVINIELSDQYKTRNSHVFTCYICASRSVVVDASYSCVI